jgi:hypothetical protein
MTDSDDGENSAPGESANGANQKTGLMIGGALVVIISGFAAWSLLKGEPPEPPKEKPVPAQVVVAEPEPDPVVVEPEPVPEPVIAEPEPEPDPEPVKPKVVLPTLEKSDKVVFKELTNMSWHHDFAALFVNKDIIRRFVVFVDNMASGTVVREFASFKPPISRFKVLETEQETFIDDSSFERYDVYLAIVNSADPKDMVMLYNKFKPLVKEVYDEIGYPDHDFTDTLVQAIDHILETPVVEGRIELVSPKVMYDYKNEEWQDLTHVQRQVMRLGSDNVKKLKPLLRKYRSLLAQ